MRIVVTGAAGRVGSALTAGLRDSYDVLGVDRRAVKDGRWRRVDATRLRPLVRAFSGAEVVVDLAADPRLGAPWRSAYRNNIRATRNVLEAAKLAGVRRVIYASSNAVCAGYETEEPWASVVVGRYAGLNPAELPKITTSMPVRPSGPYALSKVFGEAACRYYADYHGLSTVCLRLGSVRNDRPPDIRGFATLLTHGDLRRLVHCAIQAKDLRYALAFGVSANRWGIWSLDEAHTLLGYEPLDNAESWR